MQRHALYWAAMRESSYKGCKALHKGVRVTNIKDHFLLGFFCFVLFFSNSLGTWSASSPILMASSTTIWKNKIHTNPTINSNSEHGKDKVCTETFIIIILQVYRVDLKLVFNMDPDFQAINKVWWTDDPVQVEKVSVCNGKVHLWYQTN